MRNSQRFSRRNLKNSYLRNKNQYHAKDLDDACFRVSKQIYSNNFTFGPIGTSAAKGKSVYQIQSLRDQLVLEKINDNLKRAYNIDIPSRDGVVDQVDILLKENFPKEIVRLDIKSCFESIKPDRLLKKVGNDGLVTRDTLYYLRQFFERSKEAGAQGLPRGVSVSSTLLEIALIEFDHTLRRMPNVYYYGRFVDDIIVFCTKDSLKTVHEARKRLQNIGLFLNESGEKFKVVDATKSKSNIGVERFSYLGYQFEIPLAYLRSKDVRVKIASEKINKVKTRIVRSYIAYSKDQDYSLLKDRLRFLMGSSPVYSGGGIKTKVKNGLPWSYKNINDYSQLKELDKFHCKIVYCGKGSLYNKYISMVGALNKKELSSFSFYKSFFLSPIFDFSLNKVTKIMRGFRE